MDIPVEFLNDAIIKPIPSRQRRVHWFIEYSPLQTYEEEEDLLDLAFLIQGGLSTIPHVKCYIFQIEKGEDNELNVLIALSMDDNLRDPRRKIIKLYPGSVVWIATNIQIVRRYCTKINNKVSGPHFCGFTEKEEKLYTNKYALVTKLRLSPKEVETLKKSKEMGIIDEVKAEKDAIKLNFYAKMDKIKAKVVGKYIKCSLYLECRCPRGHVLYLMPNIKFYKRSICDICSKKILVISELKFYSNIKKLGSKMVSKFINNTTPVKCVCSLGYFIEIIPENLGSYRRLYTEHSSRGEQMTFRVLKKNFSNVGVQIRHPKIRRLKFDFRFIYENKTIYVEYDGEQHQKEIPYFHISRQDFVKSRQRDLIKNYVCFHEPNTMLIRLDHKWIEEKRSDEELEQYILNSIESKQKIVANPITYTWIDDVPFEKTLRKYIIDDFVTVRDNNTNKRDTNRITKDEVTKRKEEIVKKKKIRIVVNE